MNESIFEMRRDLACKEYQQAQAKSVQHDCQTQPLPTLRRTSSNGISISISEISYLRKRIAVPIETDSGRARMRWAI